MVQLSCHWKDFIKFCYLSIFRKLVEKGQVSLKSYNKRVTPHEYLLAFMIVRRRIRRMRNVLDENFRGNENTHFIFTTLFPKIMLSMR